MDHASNLHAPPRLLLWAALTLFVLIVIAGLGGIGYFSSGRLASLLPYAVIGALALFLSVIGGAVLFAAALAPVAGEPVRGVFLAFAPGGLVEMGLIALGLKMSILYVTAHHLLRIILAVSAARVFGRRVG